MNISRNEESSVDKRLVAKLFVTYLHGKTKKQEVLQLIARILNLTDDEKLQIGLGSIQSNSWIPFFGTVQKSQQQNDKTFTDLWVEFLLKSTEDQQT